MADFDIQRAMVPLLQALRMPGLGPRSLEERVAPGIEILEMLAASSPRFQRATNAALAPGGVLTLTVPATEMWLVRAASFEVGVVAGVTELWGQIRIATTNAEGTCVANGGFDALAPTSAGFLSIASWTPSPPFVLMPGQRIFGELAALTGAANANCNLNVEIGVLG